MLRKFCILDLSKHWAVIRGDCDSCQTSAMPIFTFARAPLIISQRVFVILLSLFGLIRVSCWRVFRSLWPLSLMMQDERSCEFTGNWSLFVVFAAGARTVKMYYFARLWYHLKQACIWKKRLDLTISGKQSIKLILPMLRSAPYLWLVTYWQSTLSDYVEKLVGEIQKHQLL